MTRRPGTRGPGAEARRDPRSTRAKARTRTDGEAPAPGRAPASSPDKPHDGDLTDTLHDLLDQPALLEVSPEIVQRAVKALGGPLAEVQLPRDELLRMRLVPDTLLLLLDDAQRDASMLQNLSFMLVGAFLSWVVAALTAVDPSTAVWAFGAALAGAGTLAASLAARAARRAQSVRRSLRPDGA